MPDITVSNVARACAVIDWEHNSDRLTDEGWLELQKAIANCGIQPVGTKFYAEYSRIVRGMRENRIRNVPSL